MAMSKWTLKALKGSIRKWERIVAGTGVDKEASDCPLCELYKHDVFITDTDCQNCPVSQKTGNPYCEGSPYDDWRRMPTYHDVPIPDMSHSIRANQIAQKELEFLKSLLPEEEKEKQG